MQILVIKPPQMCVAMILPFTFVLSFLQNQCSATELVKRPNGYFVTGAGCGIDAPIRHLNYFPKDFEGHQCTFINVDTFEPIHYFTIASERSGRVIQAKSLTSIVIWDYNGEDNQLWYWDPSNGHYLRNKAFPNKVQNLYIIFFFNHLEVLLCQICRFCIMTIWDLVMAF